MPAGSRSESSTRATSGGTTATPPHKAGVRNVHLCVSVTLLGRRWDFTSGGAGACFQVDAVEQVGLPEWVDPVQPLRPGQNTRPRGGGDTCLSPAPPTPTRDSSSQPLLSQTGVPPIRPPGLTPPDADQMTSPRRPSWVSPCRQQIIPSLQNHESQFLRTHLLLWGDR